MRAVVLLAVCACSQGELPVSATPDIHADVRGASTDPCTLTIANAGANVAYDISAPVVAAVPAPATREPLGMCSDGPTEDVLVTPRGASPLISVVRSSSCLVAFGAPRHFFDALAYDTQHCPKTANVTLTCGGVTLYDAAPSALCTVGM